jgi:DnaJ domain
MNYYAILGVSPNAEKDEIKAAYYRISKSLHPDMLPQGTPEQTRVITEEKYKQVNAAYEVLSDIEARKKYDEKLGRRKNSKSKQEPVDSSAHTQGTPRWLDEWQIDEAAESLQHRINKLKRNIYKKNDERIKKIQDEAEFAVKKVCKELSIQDLETFPNKDQLIIQGIIFVILGILIMLTKHWLIGLTGLCALYLGTLKLIRGIQMSPALNQRLKQAKILKRNVNLEVEQLGIQKIQEFEAEIKKIKNRIRYFQSIPVNKIDNKYFDTLNPDDQILLIVAIHNLLD